METIDSWFFDGLRCDPPLQAAEGGLMNKQAEELKAFFSAEFLGCNTDMRSGGGCETCGDGEEAGMSLERIRETIDKFFKKKP